MSQQSIDVTYQIVTNLSCNLDCAYCYERKYPSKNDEQAVVDFLHACFDRDKNKPGIGGAIIDIIGGEPFMMPKLLIAAFETAEELCKRDNRPYVFSISTNGTLFDRAINRGIVERWAKKLSIGVSIDGLPETHDKYRIYTSSRRGSYEKAVEGYNYLKSMKIRELGLKATFTMETMNTYAAGMKSLIDLTEGSTNTVNIYGNIVYEDVVPRSKATWIANQMIEVIEYWMSKGMHLDPRNIIGHLTPEGWDAARNYDPDNRDRLKNNSLVQMNPDRLRPYCGAGFYMTSLGFDRKVYGCNRFLSTVTTRQAIADLVGREIVPVKENNLMAEIATQYKDYPKECIVCPSKQICGNCTAAPYENGNGDHEARKEYHERRPQCGWTAARTMVARWWKQRIGTYGHASEMLTPEQKAKAGGCGSGSCGCKDNKE